MHIMCVYIRISSSLYGSLYGFQSGKFQIDLTHILGQDAATSSTAWRGEFWWQFLGVARWKSMVGRIPYPLVGILTNRFINPYYRSLDPGTYDIITPWKFNKKPLKISHPKRKGSSSSPIIFQWRAVKLRGCNMEPKWRFGSDDIHFQTRVICRWTSSWCSGVEFVWVYKMGLLTTSYKRG